MILERTVIQCKAGGVGAFVEEFKQMGESLKDQDVIKGFRILTDLTGPFDTIVIESQIESIDAYFAMLQRMFAESASRGEDVVPEAYHSGSRTFYTIEASY